jgi:hypothetical protein
MDELVGFASIVPGLVDGNRKARYREILESLVDKNSDVALELYEAESGSEEGEGHADFDRTAYGAALVLAYEMFIDHLARELALWTAHHTTSPGTPPTRKDLETRFPNLVSDYQAGPGIDLWDQRFPTWGHVDEIRRTRNAVVHSKGLYNWKYFEKADRTPLRFSSQYGRHIGGG